MKKYFTLINLQYLLFFFTTLFVLENLISIHLPFLRYSLSVIFVIILIFVLWTKKKSKVKYGFLVYPLIVLSLSTFIRGLESDDLSIKKYLSSTYSFYFFPLLMLIRIDLLLLYFLKSLVFISFLINILVLFTLPFWLESPFFVDQISRTILSVSGIIYFFLIPYVARNKTIMLLNLIFAIVINIIVARRAETFFLAGIFIYNLLEGFYFKPGKNSIFVLLTIVSILFFSSTFGFGNMLLERFEEGYDNRDIYFEEVLLSLSEKNSFVFGEGSQATYYSDFRREDRNIVEHGYYDMLMRSGIIFVSLFCLISILAAYRGFFKSNNTFTRRIGVYIILYLVLMFGHGVFEFSYRVFFLWLSISICLSNDFFKLKDIDIHRYLNS